MSDDLKPRDLETDEEYQKMLNDYQSYIQTFVDGFLTKLYSDGIINEISMEKLQKYFANPDTFQKELEDLAQYYYISSGEIHQLFELVEALPTLNYKIDTFEKPDSYEKYLNICNKYLYKVKHKTLTRDLLKQLITSGTVVGIWLGDKNNPYPFIFDNLKYIFPAYRKNGEWQVLVDMSWFNLFNDVQRKIQLQNLYPYIKDTDYERFKKEPEKYQYVELPLDRTFTLRTHTLKRNQNLGLSWSNPALYDVLHKKKLKDVERAIANKIINAVAVLTIGDNNDQEYRNLKLNPAIKKKIHQGVKNALEKNQTQGVTVITIPEFSKLDFPDVKSDGLNGKKFEHIDLDIQSALGVSGAILNGSGGNHASAKINFDTLYKRIAVMLEQVETDVYRKLFNLILPKSQEDNFYLVYDKEPPLTKKEKTDILMRLNDKGWSIKHVVDSIDGVSWESYLSQTIYETEELKLQDKIKPYKSTHTTSGKDLDGGRPLQDDLTDEGASTRDSGKNDM